ncbi:MAG: cell wall metabolism sensor histidine kinase WalK [Chloroflexaceae bacterium]|nr:cell wall metabolism sensor histidine kinase WalK [Chloroflexaceae bacterium]
MGRAGFTHPILKLVAVAQAVADGDLSRRANLTHRDEIGKLGRAFDTATVRIQGLLEQQARAAGERQAILQSIADGVLAVDTEERIVVINPAARMLLEQHAENLLGRSISTLRISDENPLLTAGLSEVVQQVREELTDEARLITEHQVSLGKRIVRIRSAPTLVGDEQTGAVIIIQDVTRAVELDQAKSEFIAIASHELRTPLASLKGFVDVFLMSGTSNLNESQRMFLDTIKRQTDNLTMLVNDLIEMARLEQGTQRVERRWVSVAAMVETVLSSLTGLVERRNVQLDVSVQEDLPAVWIDNLHLRLMLANLISNAIKYVYNGGQVSVRAYTIDDPALLPSPSFELEWQHTDETSLLVVVEDNGVGIREADQDKVFMRFFRSENPLSVEVGGTGLGLAITYSLVALHECQIGFQSKEGEGTCFWIRIPITRIDSLAEDHHEDGTVVYPSIAM